MLYFLRVQVLCHLHHSIILVEPWVEEWIEIFQNPHPSIYSTESNSVYQLALRPAVVSRLLQLFVDIFERHPNVCLPACDQHLRGIHGGRGQSVMGVELWVVEEGDPRIVSTILPPRYVHPIIRGTMAWTP